MNNVQSTGVTAELTWRKKKLLFYNRKASLSMMHVILHTIEKCSECVPKIYTKCFWMSISIYSFQYFYFELIFVIFFIIVLPQSTSWFLSTNTFGIFRIMMKNVPLDETKLVSVCTMWFLLEFSKWTKSEKKTPPFPKRRHSALIRMKEEVQYP